MNDVMQRLGNALEGRYTIERELGQGGMATVYLAADIKHDRKVALKVLKPELAAVLGAERFVVEIKTTASLQHPHILPLFDSGEAGGFLFYVMPFIDGETLRSKLDRETQFGIDEAIRITTSLADALDYAHRHGVIHRDIKPENILLHDGRPMVADFGIALALSAAAGGRMTETGLSLGTPHYMSPEQAPAAKEISGRSDIYSLASVLYEMLTGEPPHMGKSAQQIIMKIITETPQPVTELRKSVPAHIAAAVAQALEKLPADRFATAADFAAALEGRLPSRTTVLMAAGGAHGNNRWRRIAMVAGGTALAFALLAGWSMTRVPKALVTRVSVSFPETERLQSAPTKRFDISADGRRIVYVGSNSAGGTQLWVREFDALVARPLPGTANALAPFFSPDGDMVGFTTGAGGLGSLRVVPINGGPSLTLVKDSVAAWGGDWGSDGNVYFTLSTSVVARVRATGGSVEVVSTLDSTTRQVEHDWVDVLPGNHSALVQIWTSSIGDASIGALDFSTGKATSLFNGVYARYLPTGHILYATFGGSLLVVPFDVKRLEVTGPAIGITDGIQVDANSGSAQFAVSNTGTLLYMSGGGAGGEQVVWVDRKGAFTPVDSAWRGSFVNVSLSPDGTRLAVASVASDGEHIWVKQLPTGPLTRLTVGATSNSRPTWALDGRHIAYVSTRGGGRRNIWVQRADGSAPPESLFAHPRQTDEIAWTPDGKTMVLRVGSGGTRTRDILAFTPGVDTAPRPVVATDFDEFGADISPDGRWVAYVSNESGRNEIYVRRMDDLGEGRHQVSADGGEEPRWSRNGREIFFKSGRGEMLVANVTLGARFETSNRRALFSRPNMASDINNRAYDVSRDGSRFVMINRAMQETSELVVVLNWFEELKQRSKGAGR